MSSAAHSSRVRLLRGVGVQFVARYLQQTDDFEVRLHRGGWPSGQPIAGRPHHVICPRCCVWRQPIACQWLQVHSALVNTPATQTLHSSHVLSQLLHITVHPFIWLHHQDPVRPFLLLNLCTPDPCHCAPATGGARCVPCFPVAAPGCLGGHPHPPEAHSCRRLAAAHAHGLGLRPPHGPVPSGPVSQGRGSSSGKLRCGSCCCCSGRCFRRSLLSERITSAHLGSQLLHDPVPAGDLSWGTGAPQASCCDDCCFLGGVLGWKHDMWMGDRSAHMPHVPA